MLWYTWKQKNINTKYKKNRKNNKKRKSKIIKTKQEKNKNINFKRNINVVLVTSREHQKSCASKLLVSVK